MCENLHTFCLFENSHAAYLSWKRKNVTLRGMQDRYNPDGNGGGARFGDGLYTAALGNKQLAREYGKVYFVLGAIPKHPKIVYDTNYAEIALQRIIGDWCKNKGIDRDPNEFFKATTIADEMMRLGYDGLVIQGREMVNYDPPEDVLYFETENELIGYYEDVISQQK